MTTLILVNLLGCGLIALIVWWFWLQKPTSTQAQAHDHGCH